MNKNLFIKVYNIHIALNFYHRYIQSNFLKKNIFNAINQYNKHYYIPWYEGIPLTFMEIWYIEYMIKTYLIWGSKLKNYNLYHI